LQILRLYSSFADVMIKDCELSVQNEIDFLKYC
jgi:hypothetical protein